MAQHTEFRLFALRFHFVAKGPLNFTNAGNRLRGRFGATLRALNPEAYQSWFEPASTTGPSGLADRPRPFVFRVAHLEGRKIEPGEPFDVGFHLFDLRQPRLGLLKAVFAQLLDARLEWVEGDASPLVVSLEAADSPITRVRIQFLTPTELKAGGLLAHRPDFGILAARVRDRVAALAGLYGGGALPLDFTGFARRAALVEMTRCDIQHISVNRRSARTGQTHPLGGFVGHADYYGDLSEFTGFLHAAEFTGVGRQTAWGKGQLLVDAD